jgi:hypothetical protein
MKVTDLALERFRALETEKPHSKISFFRALYPEITAALTMGHTLREIHRRLVEDGVDVSYPLLRNYVNRIRSERSLSASTSRSSKSPLSPVAPARTPTVREDPMANAMRALSQPRYSVKEAMCDGDPSKRKLV